MSDYEQMEILRSWITAEMIRTVLEGGKVNDSESARMRALSKASAYSRVLDKMDSMQAEKKESKNNSEKSV